MLPVLQSQTLEFQSNHGNHPEFASFSFGGTKNIGNAKDFPPNLASLELPGRHQFFPENQDSAALRWAEADFSNGRTCCGLEIENRFPPS